MAYFDYLAWWTNVYGWAAVILGPASLPAGLWVRRRWVTVILVGVDGLVALAGVAAIVAIKCAPHFPGEQYTASFPVMDSFLGMALSAFVYLAPFVAWGLARLLFPFCDWWYRGGKAKIRRAVTQ